MDMSHVAQTVPQGSTEVPLAALLAHITYEAKIVVSRVQGFTQHPSSDTRASIRERAIQLDGAWRAVYQVFQYPRFENEVWELVQTLDKMHSLVHSLYPNSK